MASSLVSIALPPPLRARFLVGGRANDFIQSGAGIAGFAQDSSKALLGLSRGSTASDDDRNLYLGDIHSFVQDLVGDERWITPIPQAFQDLQTLLPSAMIQEAGDQEPS